MIRTRYTDAPHKDRHDLSNLKRIVPFLWEYKGRVLVAMVLLILAKVATVAVPFVLKEIVDLMDSKTLPLVLPVTLLLGYGALRLLNVLFSELRDTVFARVRYRAMRNLSREVLSHLYSLSLQFHLERRTGGISRDLERGTRAVSSIMNYLVFNIIPTMAEFLLVAFLLLGDYDAHFAIVTFSTILVYVAFTLSVTNWRMHIRHYMNRLDSSANAMAVDGLINFETVKYFNNDNYEINRYDNTLDEWEDAAVKSQASMSILNFSQGCIIAVGVTIMMFYAAQGVVDGSMSIGDLVLVNALMLQLFIPLNFLGIIYRSMMHSLADIDLMFGLLDKKGNVTDKKDAVDLNVSQGVVRFDHVDFGYQPERQILYQVSFEIPAGKKLAVVGPSGAGKSTLSRLLFRFYDVDNGSVSIDGQTIRDVTQESLRQTVGIVPQDTVLFNESIYHNIVYARPDATEDDVIQAAKMANIHDFISALPDGYNTIVGERGLKLSGGEKQRVAIARVILKNPKILVFDEATSSLDSQSEQVILTSLAEVSQQRTTLVIAHRLSTIADADIIIVLENGQIKEQGNHQELLAKNGLYTSLWTIQQQEKDKQEIQ
ncbi:MAG: ABC transporter ATP-binding protein/permease [gamma proteobacterium symbiont of Bathyaustriella thionipta]|nr:ABC transporter ATP-binding protein/permease [gamma proteobacterium symbiont of Bathyaustriella thionipta]MCU7951230.1 ABC transporter ATP-binding protein/permease [gamma proteobacterium symbiont of Bathyaustriella thionipta]MCU7951921.1 ABC transporter ATP-binding protein/permease [gamma proteobacterium symbiont of Bathyaustriella thionipta]MCU7957756.1 ABC transporter ATP-binding protein/permease [gamma proteobacterium symbiont of Bathyaustriella thionipta]MCU7968378.1 ABC transporter ATP-